MRRYLSPVLLALALALAGCATPGSTPVQLGADLVLDPNDLTQEYLGLGAQIWTGDTARMRPLDGPKL